MHNFIHFKVNNYRVALNEYDLLLLADLKSDMLHDDVHINNIEPLNSSYSSATHHMYFEGYNQIECLAINDLHYLDDVDEQDISFFPKDTTDDGIIGFILQREEIFPIINPLNFSEKWLSE